MSIVFRWLATVAALAAATAAGAAPATVRRADRARSSAPEYLRLNEWARAREFSVRWLERDRVLQLSNRTARLVFNVDPRQDTRRAEINGVEVWLAFPLVSRNGSVSISQTDLGKTLAPVLWPAAHSPARKIRTICLDPGHGGADPGYLVGGNEEQKYTLLLAQEVRAQLQKAGFDVVLTRSANVSVDRAARPELARRRGADLFVSLHFNASPAAAAQVKGIEIYCLTPAGAFSANSGGEGDTRWVTGNRNDEQNMLLAYQLQRSCVETLEAEDRGIKRARFEVLRLATMPAVLIEGGFMSHPVEGKKIFDPAYRRQMARAIVAGILAYQRAVKG